MSPLFLHQAVIPLPQSDRLGQYAPQSTSVPPQNVVLDSLLTGYLWACLLLALFLVVYFGISFCVWAMSTVLTTIDAVIEDLQPRGGYPNASTHVTMAASPWPERYNTVYLQRDTTPDANDTPIWRWDNSDQNLWDVLSPKEKSTLLDGEGVKDYPDHRQRSESIEHSIHQLLFDSEVTSTEEALSNTTYAPDAADQFTLFEQD